MKYLKTFFVIIAVVGFIYWIAATSRPMHKTTFAGKPVYGLVNPDGTYSFYRTNDPRMHICTLPQDEAVKLH